MAYISELTLTQATIFSKVPKYIQIKDQLHSMIRSEEYSDGKPFFTEKEICEKYGVSSITAKRVLNELSQLGIVERRRGAGTFVCKNSCTQQETSHKVIGVLLYEPFHILIPWMVDILKEAALAAKEKDCDLKILISSGSSATRVVENTHVDGLVVACHEITDKELEFLRDRYQNLITLGRGENIEGIHTINCSSLVTMLLIGEHLASLGHRRVGFVHGPSKFEFTHKYLQGYHMIVSRFDFDEDESLVVESGKAILSTEDEIEHIRRLLLSSNRPTALILPSWEMAERVSNMASTLGLNIPDDLSIISLSDPFAQEPIDMTKLAKITYIHHDNKEKGERAIRLLLKIMAGEPCSKNTFMKPQLIVQESTGPAPVRPIENKSAGG
jgi:DNA-binding LacI/PurR family transcriptional regulator